MKKLLLCGLALSVTISVSAQNRSTGKTLVPVSTPFPNKIVNAAKSLIGSENATPVQPTPLPAQKGSPSYQTVTSVNEFIIGHTEYDLQSNRGPARRIVRNSDGTMSASWTGSSQLPRGTWPDRGSYYNYFDGTSWGAIPSARVETVRTGFTNISVSNGNEYLLTHNGGGGGVLNKRTKGAGTWTEYTPVGDSVQVVFDAGASDVWFRMAVGGPAGNTVHAISFSGNSAAGAPAVHHQSQPMTYSRSNDGGVTWDIKHIVLPQADSAFYGGFSAENYSIDCNGSTVVIVACDLMTDVTMWKSTDNGTTWTRTIIWAAACPAYNAAQDVAPLISDSNFDGIADTILTNAGDPNVTLDANGMAHVTWSAMRVLDADTTAGSSLGIFLTTDGIFYWNEVTAGTPRIIAGVNDQNGDGVFTLPQGSGTDVGFGRYGNGGLSIHPQIGFAANGDIFLAYSSVSEITDTTIYTSCALRHIFVTGSTDNGATWSTPLDVVPSVATGYPGSNGEFEEGVWPSIAKNNDNNQVNIVYQRDATPEYFVNNTATAYGPQNTSTDDIVYVGVPINDILLGVKEITVSNASANIYPNPAKDNTVVSVDLKQNNNVTINVVSVVGQVLSSNNLGNLSTGKHSFSLDVAKMTPGLYIVNIKVGNELVSQKLNVIH